MSRASLKRRAWFFYAQKQKGRIRTIQNALAPVERKTRWDSLPHDTGTALRSQKDHPQAVQQLLRRQLYPSRQRRRSSLSTNALCFCVLPLLSECSFERSGGRRTGGGVFFIRHEETLRDMWKRVLFRRQPREILR